MTLTQTLATMHTYCRPHGSRTEQTFIDQYIRPLGAVQDIHRNWHVTIGDAPVIYSCHTDTVHHTEGRQAVTIVKGLLQLTRRARKRSSCLGADDTVGVFLMREMILAGVPGRYIFHFGEEAGCIGSRRLASDDPEWLHGYTAAIAFDRAGTEDVITHQMGCRTSSDTFASALADQLNAGTGLKYTPCDRGVYTDTESYSEIIAECTNVSVGYNGAHGRRETVDVAHVLRLLSALLVLDSSLLPIERNPADRASLYGYLDWPDVYEDEDEDEDGKPINDKYDDHHMYLNLDLPAIQRTIAAYDRDDDDDRSWWQRWARKGGL